MFGGRCDHGSGIGFAYTEWSTTTEGRAAPPCRSDAAGTAERPRMQRSGRAAGRCRLPGTQDGTRRTPSWRACRAQQSRRCAAAWRTAGRAGELRPRRPRPRPAGPSSPRRRAWTALGAGAPSSAERRCGTGRSRRPTSRSPRPRPRPGWPLCPSSSSVRCTGPKGRCTAPRVAWSAYRSLAPVSAAASAATAMGGGCASGWSTGSERSHSSAADGRSTNARTNSEKANGRSTEPRCSTRRVP